jgi:TetR/AcrR family transcriptional regulator
MSSRGRPRKVPLAVDRDPRSEIIAAATRLFARRGIAATTMAEIAESAGLGASSLYYWFRSKQQILEVIIEDVNRAPLQLAEDLAARPGPALGRLRELIQLDVEALCALPFDINEVHRLAAEDDDAFDRYWSDRRRLIDAVERLVAEGIRSGELRAIDPHLTALTLLANDEATQNWFRGESGYDAGEVAAHVTDLAVRSLQAI